VESLETPIEMIRQGPGVSLHLWYTLSVNVVLVDCLVSF
jgi:hypothetical protein